MKINNISFSGIYPFSKKNPNCEAALDKVAEKCFDEDIDFTTLQIGDKEYVFTDEDVHKYLDDYEEAKMRNNFQIAASFELLSRVQASLNKLKPEEIKPIKKPSIIDNLMPPETTTVNIDPNLSEEAKMEYALKESIKAGFLPELLNNTCFILGSTIDTNLTNYKNLLKSLEPKIKNLKPLNPSKVIKAIDENKFDVIKGKFV